MPRRPRPSNAPHFATGGQWQAGGCTGSCCGTRSHFHLGPPSDAGSSVSTGARQEDVRSRPFVRTAIADGPMPGCMGEGQGCIAKGGGYPLPPPPNRPSCAQPLSPWRLVPASTAFVTDSNRPRPLWQPPPTACLTASGAASEIPSLLLHPGGGFSAVPRREGRDRESEAMQTGS